MQRAGRESTQPAPHVPGVAHSQGSRVDLRLPTIDHTVVPSYGFAQRAHWIILVGFAALGAAILIASLVIKMDVTITASGVIEPSTVWSVRSLEAGVLVDILARTGEPVTRGMPVAVLDRFASEGRVRELEFRVRELRAELDRAARALPLTLEEHQERLAILEAAVFRSRAVLRERVVQMSASAHVDSVLATYVPGSSSQIDLAYADLRAAEAELRAGRAAAVRLRTDSIDLVRRRYELERLEEELARMREQVDRLTIVAPADGVILTDQLDRRIGSFVQAGEQVLEIADLDCWRVSLLVSERDVHDVRPGQRATIEIPALKALDGRQLQGRVLEVSPQPTSFSPLVEGDPALASPGSFRVTVALEPSEIAMLGTDALRRGYAVRGRVVKRSGQIARLALAALRDWVNQHRWW